ncbi:ABC transporter permease (plasmid) [Leisingera sp. S132]|uniref:ABC transporter permease n=1 Tax=Leisingera sp. S132 TaxID=2867016 RepID=UPI0021A9201B|nr:ABC transporter permease [Leisingera sp. S132]UWQ81936.1 ABC transporter permease [Leisingera sp. S132]
MASFPPAPDAIPAPPPAAAPVPARPAGHRRFATLRTVAALVLREMSTRYGRTPGGYIWAVLEPLAAILFLAVGFSLVLHTPSLGTSFLLFYATGYLPFNLYQSVSLTVSRAISFSHPLLRFPAVTWADAVIARFLLNSLTGVLVTLLLLGGILAVIDSRTVLELPQMAAALGLAMLLGLGVGTLNCVLMGLYPLWEVIWSIVTRPLFLASGIFFLYDDMPPLAQEILWYNPLIHIAGIMRAGVYPTYTPAYVNVPFVVLSSLVLLALGMVLLGRFHRVILNR